MTISELGSIGEFIGSIVLIVTLAYLAIQVRQNTAQQKRDATISIHRGQNDIIAHMMDPGIVRAYVEHAMAFNPRRDPRLLRVSLLHNLRQHADGTLSWKTDRRRPFDLEGMRESLATLAEGVAELGCPTLVVRGTESDVFSDDDAESFARALPDGRWVRVAGAGHTIQGDQPAALVDEIRGFLASI